MIVSAGQPFRYNGGSPAACNSEAASTRRVNLPMRPQCSILDCSEPSVARSWCRRHYHRWNERGGDPAKLRSNKHLSAPVRFSMKVRFTDTCWLWTAHCDSEGYGRFTVNGRRVQAHRYAYEFCVGVIPGGLTIDHLCRVHNCVNPDHLEAVTLKENLRRGAGYPSDSQRTRMERVNAAAKVLSEVSN